jgi:hypothetical protein
MKRKRKLSQLQRVEPGSARSLPVAYALGIARHPPAVVGCADVDGEIAPFPRKWHKLPTLLWEIGSHINSGHLGGTDDRRFRPFQRSIAPILYRYATSWAARGKFPHQSDIVVRK